MKTHRPHPTPREIELGAPAPKRTTRSILNLVAAGVAVAVLAGCSAPGSPAAEPTIRSVADVCHSGSSSYVRLDLNEHLVIADAHGETPLGIKVLLTKTGVGDHCAVEISVDGTETTDDVSASTPAVTGIDVRDSTGETTSVHPLVYSALIKAPSRPTAKFRFATYGMGFTVKYHLTRPDGSKATLTETYSGGTVDSAGVGVLETR